MAGPEGQGVVGEVMALLFHELVQLIGSGSLGGAGDGQQQLVALGRGSGIRRPQLRQLGRRHRKGLRIRGKGLGSGSLDAARQGWPVRHPNPVAGGQGRQEALPVELHPQCSLTHLIAAGQGLPAFAGGHPMHHHHGAGSLHQSTQKQ
ncbi:hypothetical protein CGX12_13175 [Zobellella denitrificans]|nr:hypothetical protein CGX12_13175 [Zobellella denitrificans]